MLNSNTAKIQIQDINHSLHIRNVNGVLGVCVYIQAVKININNKTLPSSINIYCYGVCYVCDNAFITVCKQIHIYRVK